MKNLASQPIAEMPELMAEAEANKNRDSQIHNSIKSGGEKTETRKGT